MKKPHGIHHALATGLSLIALGLAAPAHAEDAPAPVAEPETLLAVGTPPGDATPEALPDQGTVTQAPVVDAPVALDGAPVTTVTEVPEAGPAGPEVVPEDPPTVVEDTPDLGRPGVTGVDESFVEKTATDYNPEIAYNMAPVGAEPTPDVAVPVVDAEAASAAISAVAAGQQLEASDADSVSTEVLASPVGVEAKLEGMATDTGVPMIRNGHLISN